MKAWAFYGGFGWKSGEGHSGHTSMDELSIPEAGSTRTSLPANSWLRGLVMGAVAVLFSYSSPQHELHACLPVHLRYTIISEHAFEVSCDFPQL